MSSSKHRAPTCAADIAGLQAQLASANEKLAELVKVANVPEAVSFTIDQFCRRNGLSPSQYFKLQRERRGPRVMRTGSVGVRISREAEVRWIAEREAEAAAQREHAKED